MHHPARGELVRLRAREEGDAPLMYRWINDWETLRYLGGRYVQSMAFEQKWVQRGDPSFGDASFIIESLDGEPIGWTGLHGATPETRAASLGIAIGEHRFREGGYGSDATRTVCRFGFESMNLHRIDLTVFTWNTRAIRAYEKVGFQHEGVLRHAMFKAGRWEDLVYMGLLREDLR